MTDLEFLRLNGLQKFLYKLRRSVLNLPKAILNAIKGIIGWIVGIFKGVGKELYDIFDTFRRGDWKTRLSYLVMGTSSLPTLWKVDRQGAFPMRWRIACWRSAW